MNESCLVVHPHATWVEQTHRSATSQLEEAVGLVEAINLDVVEALLFQLKRVTPKTYIGVGMAAQCRDLVKQNDISVVIVNTQLSPTQQRNLEREVECKVIDRTALILEIFGERAQTSEGKLQVELAALNYQKSRLVRSWTHLERQRGGAGFMGGPGETQIETDRRLLAERIVSLKKQLASVVRTRDLHRKTRRDTPYPLVALAGYTNAGKSTLFNRLCEADVMAEDMLFATLDPTIRAIDLDGNSRIMLSDTVGFISDLPHELVAAFRATLEEVCEADIVLHIRDISHPDTIAQKHDVEKVLSELLGDDWGQKPVIEVWNKIDLLEEGAPAQAEENKAEHIVCVSSTTGEGCDILRENITNTLYELLYKSYIFTIPFAHGKLVAWLYQHGTVLNISDNEEDQTIEVRLTPSNASRFERLAKQI